MPDKEITLRVAELPSSQQSDIGIGIVRMDLRRMAEIACKEGDVVEIEGSRKTGAIALRPYPSDSGLDIIRMDGYMRKNAGTSIGEKTIVRKAEYKEAKKIVIAPTENIPLVPVPQLGERVKLRLMGRVLTKGDVIVLFTRKVHIHGSNIEILPDTPLSFSETKFVIANTEPKGSIVKVSDLTEVEVLPKSVEVRDEAAVPSTSYEDIGGLKEELRKVREMIELPLKHPEIFERLGINPPKGILLYGPPGTGKTLLARAVANECGVNNVAIAGSELLSKFLGETEKKIRDLFEQAEENAPTIIFIDELDAFAPKRGEVNNYDQFVAQLLASMDGMKDRGQVIVIAATNKVDAIDPAMRRPGRFDREIEIGVPDRDGRKEILQIHTRNVPLGKDVDLNNIADITHGYVGADLSALVKEAAMSALRVKVLPKINMKDETIDPKLLETLSVGMEDFKEALKYVEPSAMREISIDVPKVSWNDVGGLEKIKQYLKEMVEWPLKKPEAFAKMGITPPKGILLYGLPGTGKTLLAKAVASEAGLNFISIKGPELLSKWINESEKQIRDLFKRARQVAPVIVFFDEIDALAPRRDASGNEMFNKPVAQLLTELDGLEGLKGVIVIGATNRPDMLDPALLRPGRFDRHVEVPLPDKISRKKILEVHLKNVPLDKSVKVESLVTKTEGFVGADIEALCREAAIVALREDINAKHVAEKHFREALTVVKPSISREDIEKFKKRVEKSSKIKAQEDVAYLG
ncbi:VCP-like ATPase [uncultured archaeon]|nr:VCP-like ATPase [uncultured archaeon]